MYIERNKEDNLVLYKKDENNSMVNINNGSIIRYKAIYYKKKKEEDSFDPLEIESFFVGKIEEYKYHHENGFEGIFVQPMFIFNPLTKEWKRITNYSSPSYGNKYFYYPHLLMLPNFYSNHYPLYYLETCENVNLADFEDTKLTFEL